MLTLTKEPNEVMAMVITAGILNHMSLAGKVPDNQECRYELDELPGQPRSLSHACAARLPGEPGKIERAPSLLPVTTSGEPCTQTILRLAHGLGISSKVFWLTPLSYLAHQLETNLARTAPA